MKKRYQFGYLFVKVAKGLALLLIFTGVGFCVVQYTQADAEASAAAYQPSAPLQRALEKVKEAVSATARIVSSFNADNQVTVGMPKIETPRFPALINSNPDFAVVSNVLTRVDQERQQLKQSLIVRFESSVRTIQEKLRAYTEHLESLPRPSPAAAKPTPVPTARPSRAPTQDQESLFSPSLSADEINKRSASLARVKDFLKVLETKAENPENQARLSEAANQLELLDKLLPAKLGAQSNPNSTADQGPVSEERRVFLAERVEGELEQLRDDVRQVMLTAWTLDDALEQATDLNSAEREKCRVSTLAQKGIWLSGVSKVLTALLATIVGSFLILVCADLIATFLDTAEHTGVVSELVNAVRGSVVIRRAKDEPPKI